jgi:hypothetical protein
MCDLTPRNAIVPEVAVAGAGWRESAGFGRWVALGLLVVAPCVWAQQAPPPPAPAHDAPRPEDLEPGVNTSATPPSATSPPATPASRVAPAATGSTSVSGAGDTSAPKVGAKSAVPQAPAGGKAPLSAQAANSDGKGGKSGKAEDHLQLDTTQITGNQELPKVLYIVPWKRSDLGDLLGKPANSLLDEVLQPVDRDVFRRENRYYDALKPDAAAGADKAGGAVSQSSGEKR